MRKLKLEELNRPNLDEYKTLEKIKLVVVLDNVRSMHNVGSIFRTADAFMVEIIYLCGITARPPHKEIRKTALGATESVDWEYSENAIHLTQKLIDEGYTILPIEQVENSQDLQKFHVNKNEKYAIILGNEVDGVQQEIINLSHNCLEIFQGGTKHSLNVSVCAGIVLYKFFEEMS